MTDNEIRHEIIGAAIEVHRFLGRAFWNQLMKNA